MAIDPDRIQRALKYLEFFGYVTKSAGLLTPAIAKFQDWFALQQTGELDEPTLRAMETTPRCGFPDFIDPANESHRKFSALAQRANAEQVAKWRKTGLQYFIARRVDGIAATDFDAIVAQAFAQWTAVCGLVITQTTNVNVADLIIDTGKGRTANFDGPQGIVAYAFMPDGSDQALWMRFDLDETWTTAPTQRGILLLNVACHEFGHLLGLDHSKQQGALMAPYYNAMIGRPQANDDIPRIQSRYGAPAVPPTVPPAIPPVVPPGSPKSYTIRVTGDVSIDGHSIFLNP